MNYGKYGLPAQLMKIYLITCIVGLISYGVKAEPAPQPDPIFVQNVLSVLQAQRNAAQDQAAAASAQLAMAQARITELEKQLADAKVEKESK